MHHVVCTIQSEDVDDLYLCTRCVRLFEVLVNERVLVGVWRYNCNIAPERLERKISKIERGKVYERKGHLVKLSCSGRRTNNFIHLSNN